jgi:hypothetical protein
MNQEVSWRGTRSNIHAAIGLADLASQQLAQEALNSEPLQYQNELSVDATQAIAQLPIAHSTADNVLKALAMAARENALAEELGNAASKLNRRFDSMEELLAAEKEPFVLADDPIYIDPLLVERAVMPSLHNGLVEAIVSKINLATLAVQFREWYRNQEASADALKNLDVQFPSPFVTHFLRDARVDASALFLQTFQLALEIRTQVALLALHEDVGDDLRSVFFDTLPEQGGVAKPSLMRLDEKITFTDSSDSYKAVEQRLQELVKTIGSSKKISKKAQQTLSQRYDWSTFIVHALLWVDARSDELTQNIQRNGFSGGLSELPILLGGGIPGASSQPR